MKIVRPAWENRINKLLSINFEKNEKKKPFSQFLQKKLNDIHIFIYRYLVIVCAFSVCKFLLINKTTILDFSRIIARMKKTSHLTFKTFSFKKKTMSTNTHTKTHFTSKQTNPQPIQIENTPAQNPSDTKPNRHSIKPPPKSQQLSFCRWKPVAVFASRNGPPLITERAPRQIRPNRDVRSWMAMVVALSHGGAYGNPEVVGRLVRVEDRGEFSGFSGIRADAELAVCILRAS